MRRLRTAALRWLALLVAGGQVALPALANPSGGRVVAGAARIQAPARGRLQVDQTSARAIIDWDSFSIAQGEHTHFAQPSSRAIVLNRVHGGEVSSVFGKLSADGRVVLVNGAGIHFGPNAHVDVAGLLATTADVDDASFLTGDRIAFGTPGAGAVVNQGTISVRDAGLAAFVAPWVENTGTIEARLGRIQLASGDTFTLDLAGDELLEIAVHEDAASALQRSVTSSGALLADGGVIALIGADSARAALDAAINLDGIARARSLEQRGGRIVLTAGDDADVRVAGTLDTAGLAAGARGGEIAVTGGQLALASGARLDASGSAGGGAIRVGGDVQGSGALLRARSLSIASGAELRADALSAGDGGSIVAWSDGHTHFSGLLSARGALGGFAEVSGHASLSFDGFADLGAGGRLLLDPTEILIDSGPGATISPDTLRRQLIAGTSVDLLATDDIVLASTLDGRVSNGGAGGGAVSFQSTNGSILLNADLITNRGAVSLDAGVDVRMAGTGGALSGSGVAIVVSDGDTGLGSQGITVRAGGAADLEFLATSGALDLQASGDLTLNRDLGTLADPIASLAASGGNVDLPGSIVTANGAVSVSASGNLAMLGSDQIFVSNGTGVVAKGTGAINLSYGTGDLVVGDVETAGAIAIDYTGAGSSRVTLAQQLGGGTAPIGGLDVDAPVVDQAASIVAQGAVSLGRLSSTDCAGLSACTILRRDIFTLGGDFLVRGDALIDPRRALVDANGNPLLVTPVLGVTDAGTLITGATRPAQTINELAGRSFQIHDLREVVQNPPFSGTYELVLDGTGNPVTTKFAEQLITPVQSGPLASLFPNARQEVESNATSENRIGDRVDTTWILTIDTTAGTSSGFVTFDGAVGVPSIAKELQMTGFLPGSAFDREFERPSGNCPSSCATYLPTNRWTPVNPVIDPGADPINTFDDVLISTESFAGDANGVSEFFELGIVAGGGAVAFTQNVDGGGSLQLNLESAGSLSLPVRLAVDADPSGSPSADCATEVSCFGSLRIPRALLTPNPTEANPTPPPALLPIRGLDESEPTHYTFRPDLDNNNQPTLELGLLRFDGTGLILEQDLGSNPADMVALLQPRPGNSTNPTTGGYTSTPDVGPGQVGSAGGFSFSGGGGGLFGGGAGLGGAGGLPAGDTASIAATTASEGDGVAVDEEDPATDGAADPSCSRAGPSAYNATPGQAAFEGDARGEPFAVDVFCGTYRIVEGADPSGSHYGDIPFVTADFWSEAGFSNEQTGAVPAPPVP